MAIRLNVSGKGIVNQIRTGQLVDEAERFNWEPQKIKIEAIKRGIWTDPSVQEYYSTKKGVETQTKKTEFVDYATTRPRFNLSDAGADAPILSMGGDTVTGIEQPGMRENVTAPLPTSEQLTSQALQSGISDDKVVQDTISRRRGQETYEAGSTAIDPGMNRAEARMAAYGATGGESTQALETAVGDIPTRYQHTQALETAVGDIPTRYQQQMMENYPKAGGGAKGWGGKTGTDDTLKNLETTRDRLEKEYNNLLIAAGQAYDAEVRGKILQKLKKLEKQIDDYNKIIEGEQKKRGIVLPGEEEQAETSTEAQLTASTIKSSIPKALNREEMVNRYAQGAVDYAERNGLKVDLQAVTDLLVQGETLEDIIEAIRQEMNAR